MEAMQQLRQVLALSGGSWVQVMPMGFMSQ